MPKHVIKAKVRTDGEVTNVIIKTEAPLVECAVENEDGETSVMPLDKLLANHADEINANTEALKALGSPGGSSGSTATVQRGVASTAGIVTIAAVDMSKSFVISVSKGSEGTVAVNGTVAAHGVSGSITGTLAGSVKIFSGGSPGTTGRTGAYDYSASMSQTGTRTLSATAAAAAISGGTTDLTVKQYSAKLISETELSIDGACEWQVISL